MVKDITLSADDALIRRARQRAMRENRSLNSVFREWLARYAGRDDPAENFHDVMRDLGDNRAGRKFTREEMNER